MSKVYEYVTERILKEQLKQKIRNLNTLILKAFDEGNFVERDRLCNVKDDYLDELLAMEEVQ